MVTMNLPLDDNLARDLEELAARTGRPVEEIAAEAARQHLEYTKRVLDDVERARLEIAEGRALTSENVRDELARRRQERSR